VQHNAFDAAQLVRVGTTSNGNPIRLNRHLVEADLVIFTGFIEPHFFAGYSGGPKAVLPALAGAESVYSNHAYSMIAHPNATFNQLEGNPIWEEIHEAARMLPNTLLVNVTLNRSGQITGVFAGDVIAAHAEGCNFANQFNQVHLPTLYDVVITSNSGYPLDQNLYQCVKGLAAARRAVRQGGAILLVAACQEGLPDKSSYAQLLQSVKTPQQALHMLAQPGFRMQDAWQVQIQAAVQMHADVYLYSEELSDVQIQSSLLRVCRNIPQTLRELAQTYGSRICVLPEGPLVIVNPPGKAQNHKH
jgi:nickel-dependent lactate racemase